MVGLVGRTLRVRRSIAARPESAPYLKQPLRLCVKKHAESDSNAANLRLI